MAKLRYPIVGFDLDGVLVGGTDYHYVYYHLWRRFAIDWGLPRAHMERYRRGEITYERWVRSDVRLLQYAGVGRQELHAALAELRPIPGALETLQTLKDAGARLVLISGSIYDLLEVVLPEAIPLFDEININRYKYDANGNLRGVDATHYDQADKAAGLDAFARRFELTAADCAYVGDSTNDLSLTRAAGAFIAFQPKDRRLADQATQIVETEDLRDVLKYLLD